MILAVISDESFYPNMEPETLRTKGEPSVDLEKAMSTLGIDVSVLGMAFVNKYFRSKSRYFRLKFQPCAAGLSFSENDIAPTHNVGDKC